MRLELDACAAEVAHEHRLAAEAEASGLDHAILCGRALIRAHGLCPRGEWSPWVTENFAGSPSLAYLYIRCAYYEETVRTEARNLKEAAAVVTGHPGPFPPWGEADHTMAAQAREMVDGGMSRRAAAGILGVSPTTVAHWCHSPGTTVTRLGRKRSLEQARRVEAQRLRAEQLATEAADGGQSGASVKVDKAQMGLKIREFIVAEKSGDRDMLRAALYDLGATAFEWVQQIDDERGVLRAA